MRLEYLGRENEEKLNGEPWGTPTFKIKLRR